MPSIERIDQFNQQLIAIGNEEAILAERGLTIEPVAPPEPAVDDDLSALLSDAAFEADSLTVPAPAEESEGEDTAALMDNLAALFDDRTATEAEAEPSDAAEDLLGSFSLGDDDFAAPPDFSFSAEVEADPGTDERLDLDVDTDPLADFEPAGIDDFQAFTDEPDDQSPGVEDEGLAGLTALDKADLLSDLPTDTFGSDFASQVDEEFGDLGADAFGDVGFGDSDSESTEPSLDADDLDAEDLEGSLEEIGAEGFSLGDFGAEFEIDDVGADDIGAIGLSQVGAGSGGEEDVAEAVVGDRTFSDVEFAQIRRALDALPLNIRIEVEKAIGDAEPITPPINVLIDGLIKGLAPTKIADALHAATGKRVIVPKNYQKRTGLAFEAQQRSLLYQFQTRVLPVLKVAVLIMAATGAVAWLLHQFVYRPLSAEALYRRGHQAILEDRFVEGNDLFAQAYQRWVRRPWFARYAQAFVAKRQYELAVEKYDQLVFGMDEVRRAFLMRQVVEGRLIEGFNDPERRGARTITFRALNVDRAAILEHALLQSDILANYERAQLLYSILLHGNKNDYAALLHSGDNFLRWADENSARFEDARATYARLLNAHGDTDEILQRFLRYFVRTNNLPRVRELVHIFQRVSPGAVINPVIYSEAAGFLLDNDIVTDVREMLLRAFQIEPLVPEIHYELARYNRRMGGFQEERAALINARAALEMAQPLSPRRLRLQIDTIIRIGEYEHQRDNVLTAQREYAQAAAQYEEAKSARLVRSEPLLARVYANIADIAYYKGEDLELALANYDRALAEGYAPASLQFKRGYIHYQAGRFDQAMEAFFEAGPDTVFDTPRNLLYARGNTLYHRANLFGAEAYYRELVSQLEDERSRIVNLLVDEDPKHRALIEYMIRAYNNLGITLYRMYERDATRAALLPQALNYLRLSVELAEDYLRDYETGQRTAARSMANLNVRSVLAGDTTFTPQIFNPIPRDFESGVF